MSTLDTFQRQLPHRAQTAAEAASALGVPRSTYMRWRAEGLPADRSHLIRLAMAAVVYGLPPYPEE